MADQDITLVISARDEATKKIRAIDKEIKALEKQKAEIPVDVDASRAKAQIADIDAAIRKLERQKAKVNVDADGLEHVSELLDQIPGQAGEALTAISKLGSAKGLGAVAGAGVALGGAMFAAADHAADAALAAQSLASLTGTSVEMASRLQAIWQAAGADVNDLSDVLLQMNGVLAQSPEIAQQLGINLNDGKDVAGRFLEVVDKIKTSTLSAAQRSDLMSKVFGEEGVRQVQTLLTLYDDLALAADRVDSSRVFSDEDVQRAQEYAHNMAELKSSLEGLANEIGQAVLPAVSLLTDALNVVPDEDSIFGRILRLSPLRGPFQLRDDIEGIGSAGSLAGTAIAGLRKRLAEISASAPSLDKVGAAIRAMNTHTEQAVISLEDFGELLRRGAVQAIAAHNRAVDDWIDKHRRFVNAMDEARRAAEEYADPVEAAARATQALNEAFAEHDNIVSTWEQIVDVRDALRDLAEFIQRDLKGTIPNLLDPNDVNAGPYLDRFRQVRDAVQERLTEVFSEGGPQAAKNWAERQITQIERTLGGRLTREQIRELLGWEDLEVTLQVAVDKKSAADAELLGKAITAPLEVIGVQDAIDKARAEAALETKQSPFEVPIKFVLPGFHDTGGTTGPQGGIVGERRPEIVNSKWLVTRPTIVPPGTRVTSGARTARILRTRGTAGLRRYDAGGVVAGARSININVNAAVVGNRYDVMRAVKRAARDSDRLLGSRV